MTKKNQPKNPRSESIYATTAGEVSEIEIFLDSSGTISFGSPVTNTYNETSYKRRKGDKVLNRSKIDGPDLGFSPSESLKGYDTIVAIDTNTVAMDNRDLSVTGIVLAEWVSNESSQDCVSFGTPFWLEYNALSEPKEKIGWMMALHELSVRGYFSNSTHIAVIVDSFLNEIAQINAREIPVFKPYILPERCTLFYASADAGNEYLVNRLIRTADKSAYSVIKHFKNGKAMPNNKTVSDSLFKGFRVITSTHGGFSWS